MHINTTTPVNGSHILQADESRLMASLVENGSNITADLDDPNLDLEEIWEQMSLVLRTHRDAESVTLKLRPVIGRFLLVARDNPGLYESKGYSTYGDFINQYVCGQMGLSRAALYEARMIAEKLPGLSSAEYQELGPTRAITLAKFTTSGDSNFPEYLREAQTRTAREFVEWAEQRRMIPVGGCTPAAIVIQTSQDVKSEWASFTGNPSVHSFVGSASEGEILRAMIQECSSWLAIR